ncbi:ATP-binding protein [Streptomyces albipurpureus]|uniref:histidine kinase n=1 Tax=Streptomyces albipurpureus TaxID=2897419 RepID=A0ABT0UND3_9ACTN|nr:ATP-binding protein [Streptomyces sp. CWNU-1]MCM2390118.1 hypothetical protein [Streptomyces sp. CWNU-1]
MVSRAPGTTTTSGTGPTLWWPLAGLTLVVGASILADLYTHADLGKILAWACAAVALLALAWTLLLIRLLRAERTARRAEHHTAEARADEVAHLVSVRLPAITERLRAGQRLDSAPGPLAPADEVGEDFADALVSIVEALGSEDAVRRERTLRDSVQAAFESVARNMHAMATVQQQVLDRVEQTIEDPRLLAEVMKADHAAAQMTRKAQTLLVMCGIWPARRETRPVSLYDCVRGAQSRIVEFNRIEVHGGQTLYAVPPAVEGLMHTIAELLENATVFSPSRTQVMVTIREVGAGAVVEIDDAGLGMPPDVLLQSTARLKDELDLANLGAVPRLGLACVGRWARELGFSVELSGASAYGGTRAVAFVPYRLLTEPRSHFSDDRHPGRAQRHEATSHTEWSAAEPAPSTASYSSMTYPEGDYRAPEYAGGEYSGTEYGGAGPDTVEYGGTEYTGPAPGGMEYGGTGRPGGRHRDDTGGTTSTAGAVYQARGRSTASAAYQNQVRATAAHQEQQAARQDAASAGYAGPADQVAGASPYEGRGEGSEDHPGSGAAEAAAAYRGMVRQPTSYQGTPQHSTAYPGGHQDGQGGAQHPSTPPPPPPGARSDGQAAHTDAYPARARTDAPRYGGATQQEGGAATPPRPPRLRETAQQPQTPREEPSTRPGAPQNPGGPNQGQTRFPSQGQTWFTGQPKVQGQRRTQVQAQTQVQGQTQGQPQRQAQVQGQSERPGQGQAPPQQPLPRRRSRRGAAVEAAAQQALQPQPFVPTAAPVPPDQPAWTPEAARASISSVVSGSRRGRATVAGTTPSEQLSEPNPHHGGRL